MWSTTCHGALFAIKAKSQLNPYGLYMPLPIPSVPWEDISVDFVLGPEQRGGGILILWLSIVSLK
jgi:hypothetical protein